MRREWSVAIPRASGRGRRAPTTAGAAAAVAKFDPVTSNTDPVTSHTDPVTSNTDAVTSNTEAPIGKAVLAIGRCDQPALCYTTARRRWTLWWPCAACGGVMLPLNGHPRIRPSGYEPAARLRGRCPGCETSRRRRSARCAGEPSVWYDTVLSDWVVQLPSGPGHAVLPLEIHWFDASLVHVYRAASDLVCWGDAFERELGE